MRRVPAVPRPRLRWLSGALMWRTLSRPRSRGEVYCVGAKSNTTGPSWGIGLPDGGSLPPRLESRHRKARRLQRLHECALLERQKLDQRRTNGRPLRIRSVVRDRRLEGGNHRVLLEHGSHRVERRLLRIRVRIPPAARQLRDSPRVDIAGRGNATRTAAAQRREQKRFATREDVEFPGLKPLEHRLSVAPVARAVLDADDRARVSLEQSLD